MHLLGYSGPGGSTQTTLTHPRVRRTAGQGGTAAAGVCAVDNARANVASPLKTNADFVPITGDDSLGFYCVYGVKASTTGGVGGNVGIYLFELAGGEVLVFGSGYGNIPGANLFDAAYDMDRVDQVIRFCMGKDPANTPLRLVAPHGHGDHINPACNRELERLGYRILEIAFHQGDNAAISGMAWTTADRALFRVLPASTTCLQELLSYNSPLGKIWFFDRPGHTPGSIDLVIDAQNDATNRFVVRGSQPASPCAPLPGQREIINAHGNVELLSTPPTLLDVAPLAGTALGGTPLTVTGANFQASGAGALEVLVGGEPASGVVVLNDTSLTCLTPAGPPGQLVDVVVVSNNGQSESTSSFFYNAEPTVTSLAPQSGDWRGGTGVQVRGTGFLLSTGVNEVWFGARRATNLSVKSDTLLTCRTPPGTPGTLVTVEVRNQNGIGALANSFRYNDQVAITSATPASATALGGTTITLTGTAFTGSGASPTVTVGGVTASSVTLISDTSVSFVCPQGVPGGLVDIVLTNTAGSATLSGFRFHATPTVTALTPASGRASGGTLVAVSGTGFVVDGAGTNQVRFGGIIASGVSVQNDGTLTCLAPSGAVGTTVNLTVTNRNGTATLPLAFTYLQPLEVLASVPNSGSAQGGTLVTLTGGGFVDGPAGPTSVLFGAQPATQVTALDDSTLTCFAPAGAPTSVVSIQVTNANGTVTQPAAFRYHAVPTLAGLTPNHGHASAATPVTLSGTGFLNDEAGFALVVVGGVAATDVVTLSDTQLACVFPSGAPGSTVDVLLVNANGTASLAGAYRYHTLPTVTASVPNHAAAGAQPQVTLTGSGFLNDQAGPPAITFGGVAAGGVTVLSDTSVRCTAPVGTPGRTVDVVLSNARGTGTLFGGYRYHARPTLVSTAPNRGTFQGGTQVTLTGTGFQVDSPGTHTITFGGASATNVVVLNDTTLTCRTPPGTLNAQVDVVLVNANGSATLVRGFSYSVPPPAVLSLTPASGPAHAPGSVTILGSGFVNDAAGANTVRFGGVASGIVGVLDDTHLSCQVPPGTPGASVQVEVSNANGIGQLAAGFRYHGRPTLLALTPASTSALGGSTIQLTGSGFAVDSPGANLVTFGGLAASSVVVVSDTTLQCAAPAGTPGTSVAVRVSNANGDTATQPFAYNALPALLAVTPDTGAAGGGTRVSVSGSGFMASGAGTNRVTFGGRDATNVSVLSDTLLQCDTPRGGPGFVDVRLTNANGAALLANGFHYGRRPPEITSIEPASGTSRGQTVVTLRGTGFVNNNAGLNRVKFGTVLATNVITLDDETILCAAPAGTPGTTVDIGLNNNSGTVTVPAAYRYHALPTLSAITPNEGKPLMATRVTLSGSGFVVDAPGETLVLFDNVRARDVSVLDDGHLTCTAVGGSPGDVLSLTVRNQNGAATLVDAYRVIGGPPGVQSLTPNSGAYLGGTEVELVGSGFQAGGVRLRFGDNPATNLRVVDDAHLLAATPPGVLGQAVTVTLQTKNGIAMLLGGYRYTAIVPELTGVAPSDGPSLGGTRLTLTGRGFAAPDAGVTSVQLGTNAASGIVVVDDHTVTCTAPSGPPGSSVDVELTNAFGTTRLARAYRYHARPTLTALNPAEGPAAGGTRVTLTGSGFQNDAPGTNRVTFGGVAATGLTVLSDTSLACNTPSGTPGSSVDVVLANANGQAALVAGFRYRTRPVIDLVTPASGPIAGGTVLTLSGHGFQSDSAGPNTVLVGVSAALNVVTIDDTTITCTTPAGSAGAKDVSVQNANGNALLASAFTYFVPPTLSGLSPARGSADGGTSVTLSGSGFLAVPDGTNLVLFGGVAALDVVELSDTQLSCTTPPGTAGSLVDVTLANPNGLATLSAAFQYHGAPVLGALSPNHGPAAGGTTITLTGTGFVADQAGTNAVTFGGQPATAINALTDGSLTCRAPAGTAGATVDVVLTNANGSSTLVQAYRYHAEPTLTNVLPNHGPAAGGTSVTLTGTGFLTDNAGPARVLFSGFAARDVVVLSDTSLTCTSPGGNPNTLVNVTVANDNGTVVRPNSFRYNALPTLTAVNPGHGSALGGTLVTLSGSGFGVNNPGPNAVLFGTTPATDVTVLTDTTLTCTAPAGTGGQTVAIQLDNANGSATLAAAYRFDPVPTLASVAPPSGPAAGGGLVTISGSGFADVNAGAPLVTFGGVAATDAVVVNDAQVQCSAPSGPSGAAVDVVLANANGQASLTAGFRYHAVPTLVAVTPARGSSAVSSALTLSGSGFLVDGAGPNSVTFGGVPATNVVTLSDTSLSCVVAAQAAGSVVDVALANKNGSALLVNGFAFDAPAPILTSLTPTSGVSSGGTAVTLTGSGFLDFSAGINTVTFGGVAASGVSVLSDSTMTCQTPPGTIGATVDVAVSNSNGTTQLATVYTYLAPPPVLISVAAASGPANGGGTVTLIGTGFQANGAGANTVLFGAAAASNVLVLGDTSLTCTVPSGTPGTSVSVTLSNTNGSHTLPNAYRYHALPALTSIAPADGTSLGGTLVTVRGTGFVVDGAGASQVLFGGTPASSVNVVDDTRLTCRAPSGPAGTSVTLTLNNQNGSAQLASAFRYHARPTLASVTPADGPASGGTSVLLTGSGFLSDGAVVNIVAFGGLTASSVVVQNDTRIQCTVPAGTSGLTVQVTVANVNGTALLANGYRYHARPTLTAVAPPSGPAAGGTLVTLTGTGFQVDMPGVNTVTFGGVAASGVTVTSDTQLTCTTPAGTLGSTVDVALTNANGSATLLAAYTFTAGSAPIVTASVPNRGSTNGSTPVTLLGSGFSAGMTVRFGNLPASAVNVFDDQTITCLTPASASAQWVDVSVDHSGGSVSLALGFQFVAPPTLIAVEPAVAQPAGGELVTLVGSGFLDDGAGLNLVTFDGRAASDVNVLDDAHLACVVPDGVALTSGDVVLANDNGQAALVQGFRWQRRLATDLNNDGRGDLVLSSPGNDEVTTDAGAVHVFFGATLPLLDRTSAQAELTALPEAAGTTFGSAIASGDLNGDGQSELIVGAPGDDRVARDAGAVFVFAGPLTAAPTALQPSAASLMLTGTQLAERFGKSLALHDLNNDGYLDLLVGAPGRGPGNVHVYLGTAGGLGATPDLTLPGEVSNEDFAGSLAAGDLDGDGWSEIVVGAQNAFGELALSPTGSSWHPGEVRVYQGGPTLFGPSAPAPWLVFSGDQDRERFGSTLAAHDVSGDGIVDLLVGAPGRWERGNDSGAVFVFYGRSDLTGARSGGASVKFTPEAPGDRLGDALAAGDVDGDGLADILIGAPGYAGMGRAYLILGSGQLATRSVALADSIFRAESASGQFGATVALVDVDGNGREEPVITAPAFSGELGRVYVFDGTNALGSHDAAISEGKLTGQVSGDRLGHATTSD